MSALKVCGFMGLVLAMSEVSEVPALAHHSYAMFDAQKVLDLEGTMKEVEWTQPHSWLILMVQDDKGKINQWAFEMGTPNGGPTALSHQAFRANNIQAGDKMTARIHPLKNGTFGGELIGIKLSNGTQLGGRDPIPLGTTPGQSSKPVD